MLSEPTVWDMIYPDIDLINVDCRETAPKVVYLVCDILYYHYGSRVISLQARAILHDWHSAIGMGALAVVRNHFLLPGNWFNKEHIIKYVRWGLNPKKFNFIQWAQKALQCLADLDYLQCGAIQCRNPT
jgi:hypothetical protein